MIAYTIYPIHRSGQGRYLQANSAKYTSRDLALLKSQNVKGESRAISWVLVRKKGKKAFFLSR